MWVARFNKKPAIQKSSLSVILAYGFMAPTCGLPTVDRNNMNNTEQRHLDELSINK